MGFPEWKFEPLRQCWTVGLEGHIQQAWKAYRSYQILFTLLKVAACKTD